MRGTGSFSRKAREQPPVPLAGSILFGAIATLGAATLAGRAPDTSLQALLAAPHRFAGHPVTVTGRFRGRGTSVGPVAGVRPPTRRRWDFLLTADEASVWVSGIRPAGWDFDLDPRSPADARTGTWLEVTGTVRVRVRDDRGCGGREACQDVWIDASDLRAAHPPSPDPTRLVIRPAVPAPAVVFNDPIDGESDVRPATAVRLQFSRSMQPETFAERIRIAYDAAPRLGADPIPAFTAVYADGTRSLVITFAAPLQPHQRVRVELLDGIHSSSGRPLEPWSFVFTTGD